MNFRFIGHTTDGLLLFQDRDFPSDAPQSYPNDTLLLRCASTDLLIDGAKHFAITRRHAEVRGLLGLALGEGATSEERR